MKKQKTIYHLALLVMVAWGSVFVSACASTKLLETKKIRFRCDSNFNEGLILPVDLVFVPEGEKLDTITGVVPDEWFDSDVREQWSLRQSMALRASDTRKTIDVNLKKPKKTVALVIFADYRDLQDAKSQLIVLDAENAKEEEDIFITINGLLH